MDVITMSSVVQHGLIQRNRIFSVSVLMPDKAGELVKVATLIANNNGNVIKLEHNQFVSTNRNAAVELRLTIEAFGTEHKHEIMQALEEEGFVITIHGKGSFVAFADQGLMLEKKKKEVEADLEMAIRKGKSCGMTDQELLELFQIVLED